MKFIPLFSITKKSGLFGYRGEYILNKSINCYVLFINPTEPRDHEPLLENGTISEYCNGCCYDKD